MSGGHFPYRDEESQEHARVAANLPRQLSICFIHARGVAGLCQHGCQGRPRQRGNDLPFAEALLDVAMAVKGGFLWGQPWMIWAFDSSGRVARIGGFFSCRISGRPQRWTRPAACLFFSTFFFNLLSHALASLKGIC